MNHDTSKSAQPPKHVEWVMARYSGDQAKYVTGLANEGIGYKILEQPDHGNGWVKVAFRRPIDNKPREHHLAPVTDPRLLQKLDEWMKEKSS